MSWCERFWSKVERLESGCLVWTGARDSSGYGHVRMPGRKLRSCHRLSWLLLFGYIPNGMYVCHKCDNPPCVNPSHLFLGTARDNALDRDAKGRRGRGAPRKGYRRVGFGKLSDEDVRDIRGMCARGMMHRDIAARFGIAASTVSKIRNGLKLTAVA